MERTRVNMAVGIFLVLGILALGYLSIKLGRVSLFGGGGYLVSADFPSSAGLKIGANVEIAGVKIGRVAEIRLDSKAYDAVVQLDINEGIELQEDSIASIRTSGIIGDKYISITPGGFDELIPPGGEIFETEPAINIEELISKYIFEN